MQSEQDWKHPLPRLRWPTLLLYGLLMAGMVAGIVKTLIAG